MANLGIKVENVMKRFYDIKEVEDIKGMYEVRKLGDREGPLCWYFFSSNNATYHSSGNDCVIRDINQTNSSYFNRLKAAFEKANNENRKIFWLVLVFGEGIGLKPDDYEWLASIELKVDLDDITASLNMKTYPIGKGHIGEWAPGYRREEESKYFNAFFMSCKDNDGNFTSKYMEQYFEMYDNRPYHEVVKEDELQLDNKGELLPPEVKKCAKRIIEAAYEIDRFDGLKSVLEKKTSAIKINIPNGITPSGNVLPSVFYLQSSTNYEIKPGSRARVFDDREYEIEIDNEQVICRLTTEWDENVSSNNNLISLIGVVNECYEGKLKIVEMNGERYLFMSDEAFLLENLPVEFRTDYGRRFVTSLLAKPFVILTGNSGTGKTRIAKQFAEYLEKDFGEQGKNWVLVPVGADWTDNTNILGFFNPLYDNGKGSYEKTSIVQLLELANKRENRDIPFFIILDEMNLSHVERYFSDFLSHMETEGNPLVMKGYDDSLYLTDNVFVVGTVNIDETTYMFSPKVLDRANVIEFIPSKEDVLDLFFEPSSIMPRIESNIGMAKAFMNLAREVSKGKMEISNDILETDVKDKFNQVYDALEGTGFEFAFRTVKEIRQYLSAASLIDESSDIQKAVDEQLLQKVMPKIHGNKKEISELLEKLDQICVENNYVTCEKKIKQMKGKLDKVQYASFI